MDDEEATRRAVQVQWQQRPRTSPSLTERIAKALQEAYKEGKRDGEGKGND